MDFQGDVPPHFSKSFTDTISSDAAADWIQFSNESVHFLADLGGFKSVQQFVDVHLGRIPYPSKSG
jgi:hypothetical protein